jgi:hypothetical protein
MRHYVFYRTDDVRFIKLTSGVLHEFIKTNRAVLIDQCRAMVASRSEPKAAGNDLDRGIPIFGAATKS